MDCYNPKIIRIVFFLKILFFQIKLRTEHFKSNVSSDRSHWLLKQLQINESSLVFENLCSF